MIRKHKHGRGGVWGGKRKREVSNAGGAGKALYACPPTAATHHPGTCHLTPGPCYGDSGVACKYHSDMIEGEAEILFSMFNGEKNGGGLMGVPKALRFQ